MSLWSKLLETYDTQSKDTTAVVGTIPLCPAFHITQKVQVEV